MVTHGGSSQAHSHIWTASQKSSINIIYMQSILINTFDCGELLVTDLADLLYQEGGR